MDISGQIAVVTGGASGLGLATAQALAERGARVALLDIDGEQAAEAAKPFKGIGLRCDVADPASAEAAYAEIRKALGAPPRVLVSCAGIAPPARIVSRGAPMPLGDFERVVRVNLIGTFNAMRLAAAAVAELDPLATGERGVIVNTASIAAFDGQVGQTAYAASKGGVASLTLPAARELARFGIRVVTIAPGIFRTPMMQGLPQQVQEGLAALVPFPPRLGEPSEYAALACHIIENPMLNGEVIRIDGALRMPPK